MALSRRGISVLAMLVATVVGAYAPRPVLAQNCAPFSDVLASNAFCGNIQWMYNRGVTLGCSAGFYCPADYVRRDQMAAFMNRLANSLFPLTCASGQVMKWNGSTWGCANDNAGGAGPTNAYVQGGNAFNAPALIGTTDNQPLDVLAQGQRVMRYEPNAVSPNLIGGHPSNAIRPGVRGAIVAGGGYGAGGEPPSSGAAPNRVTDNYGAVGGGAGNVAGNAGTGATFATVGGGFGNLAFGEWSTVGGGFTNSAGGRLATVGGGTNNNATEAFATVAGGYHNQAANGNDAVGGGRNNVASGGDSSIPGGCCNVASGYGSFAVGFGNNAEGYMGIAVGYQSEARGDHSLAIGRQAISIGEGTMQFADSNPFDFQTSTPNAFRVRATGGVRMVVDIDGSGGTTWSCLLTSGNAWACSSDRNLKQDLVELDGQQVLDKLVAMPVYQWQPKGKNAHVKHYGPMAQDFHAAFGLGDDDTMIGFQDADGVALAAIRGLNTRLESELKAQRAELAALRAAYAADVAELKRQVEALLARGAPR